MLQALDYTNRLPQLHLVVYIIMLYHFIQAGSWAGNLMLKHKHPEFPSDMFVLLETVGAKIYISK